MYISLSIQFAILFAILFFLFAIWFSVTIKKLFRNIGPINGEETHDGPKTGLLRDTLSY